MPIIRTLKESGHSYEAAKQKLLEATAHLQEDESYAASSLQVHKAPKRNRIISDSSSSSSSSSESRHDDDDDGDDDEDDEDDEEDAISQKRQRKREKKLLRNLEKEMKRKRNVVSISRPSSYKRTDMYSITPAKPKTRKPKAALLRIAALNESSEEPDSDEESEVELTKEAQEEEAFSLYKEALEFQRSGNEDKAQETYNELLHTRFLSKVKTSPEERRGGVTNTAITLKYSTYKNLGNLALAREDTDNAMENYLEAVNLDSTDVTLWYRIGTVAVKLSQLALARVAFEQGLRCSKFHWPCLDYLCTVLYAINDYVTCLYYIAQALERDKRYIKGFALRDQIYSEQPCLRRDCLDLFKHCDEEVFYYEVPKDKRQKIVDEALSLRHKRQELAKAPPLPRIKFLQPLNEFRWKPLGERLVALYDHMTSKDPPMSLITVIDLEDYKITETGAKEIPSEGAKQAPSPTPMEVDASSQRKAPTSPGSSRREGETEGQQIPTDTPGHISGQTPGQMGGQTPGQMDGHTQKTGEPKQGDAEVPMEVDADEDSKAAPGENAGASEQTGSLGSSALTLKQLAETYLKNLGGHLGGALLPQETASASAVHVEKEQEPPDSTTAGLDSTPVPSDLPTMELLADSAAGSSQDSIQQSGRESNLESAQDKDVMARQQTKGHLQHEDAVSMDTEESQAEKSRRGPKRKRMMRDMPAPGKRRSARVRNTTVKKKEEEEIVNYTEVLRQFLPSTLLVSDEEEEELQLKKTGEKELKEPNIKKPAESLVNDRDAFAATETEDVHGLLMECQLNNGIIDVMTRYLERLVAKHDLRWPDGLAAVFLDVYKRLRKHISLPELFCCDEDEMVLREMSMMCLLSAEFNLDQCLSARTNGNTPAASPAMLGANTTTCTHRWGEHHEDDMVYLQELTLMQYMLPDLWPVVPARVYWLKARYFLQIGKTVEGEEGYERCKDVLKREEERRMEERQRAKEGKDEKAEEEKMETEETAEADEPRPVEIVVANIKHGAVISIASISSEVESLQRCQSLEQLQRLHASGDHAKVVELLRPSLRHTPRPVRPENTPERCSQLLLLIQSQLELKDIKESVLCCVLGMVETWQGVLRDGLQAYHQLWLETLNKTLVHLQKAFESCEISALGAGGTGLLRKAVNILIKIIEWTMDQADVNSTTNATSVMPWVVLYHIIKYEEDHLAAKSLPSSDHESGEGSRSPTSVPMLPSSLMLLENAHDYLGRQSWCCNCEGALLKLYIRVLSTELGKYTDEDRHPFNSDLRHTLEQCFFCLYGHPTKKAKTRHLQDHNAAEVQLDWSNCCYIFDYFKPKIFPEFDSYKASSMSGELEGLLLKISKVIPQDAKPENALEQVQGYVDGSIGKAPAVPEGFAISSTVVQELYYLLADYYFKNKDFGKAIKFYLHDLCVSPDRLDSWAGMALARVGRLDLKLNNSTDTKSDGPIFKHGMAALRCFKRALEIDATNYSLWIEYGSYAYILHSHASRQIKQKDQLKIGDEDVVSLSVKQAEMLEEAEHCFKQASLCEGEGDEEWLVHYMLGKVAEKRLLMEESLRHYLQASHHLHENEARYPKKIPYHNPTNFSLEALEMYFRIHSAILKLVQCSLPGTKVKLEAYGTLEGLVQEATQLPFVRAEEKKREPSSEPSTDTEQEAKIRPSKPDTPPSLAPKRRGSPLYVATPQDHDYLHEKYRRSRSRVSSQEEITDTASESDIFSGDESMSSFLTTQRSTITLRPVPARRALSAAEAQAVQPTPDGTPSIVGLGDEVTPKEEASQKLDDVSHEKDQPEGRTATEDTVPCQDTKEEIPAIVVSKPSPESEAAPEKDEVSVRSDVPTTSAEEEKKVTKKPDTLKAESDVSTVATTSCNAEATEAMDTEEQKEPEHVFVTPAPAPSIGEENSQDGERKTDAQSPVAMDTDDADTTRKTDAGESRDSGGSDRECPGGIKEEVEERNMEGSTLTSEEKMEVGPSGDVKEEKQGGGEIMEKELCEPQNIKIIKEEERGERTIEELGNAELDGIVKVEMKEDEVSDDAETPLPGEKDDSQDNAVVKDEIESERKTPDSGDEENLQRERQGTIGIMKEEDGLNRKGSGGDGKESVVFQKNISADSSKEVLPSENQSLESIPLVDVVQGKETEDLFVAPDIKKESQPKVEGMAAEADSTKGEITKVQSEVDDLPRGHDPERGKIDEKQDQGEKIEDGEMDRKSEGHQTVSDDLSKNSADRAQDKERAEDVHHQDKVPDGRPVDGDAKKNIDQDSAEGEGKDKKNEAVKKEVNVEKESVIDVQERSEEMMDTSNQGKSDADQNKEDNSTKIPITAEGSEASSTVDATKKEDDIPRDDAVSTKEKEKASGETERQTAGKTEGQTEQKAEEKKEGETFVEVDEETKKRHLKLIDACLGAMRLCLQRFPQHYKAAYRMAYLYAYAPTHKNLAWSRDILIGSCSGQPPKTPVDHIVAPALFSEQHKSKNLFQGIWRNPIQDIDRSGSFPWHMYRSVALLVYILRELKDHILLLQVTIKLYRIPEQDKKYLRDADRHFLAREGFDAYQSTIRSQLTFPAITGEERLGLVMSSFRCYQYTQMKQPTLSSLASELLMAAYATLKGNTIESEPGLLEQATRFCDHHIALHKLPRTPTHGEGMPHRSYHKDSPSSSSSRPGLSSEGRRLVGRSTSSSSDQGGVAEPIVQDGKVVGRGAGMEVPDGQPGGTKMFAEGGMQAPSAKTAADSNLSGDSRMQESVKAEEKGKKESGASQSEKAKLVSQLSTPEQDSLRRAEASGLGMLEGGVKRKFSQVESTSENIASIVQEAARQYERTEAQRRERLGMNSPAIPQAKRFAGSITETSSKAFLESAPRVHIGALGSVSTTPRNVPQQRPTSLAGTSKQAMSLGYPASVSKSGIVKKRDGPPPLSVTRYLGQRAEAAATKPTTIKSPLSPLGSGSFADSFQQFLKKQQQEVSSVVKTYDSYGPESTTGRNPAPPVSKVTSGSLLGQVGLGSVAPKTLQTSSTSATALPPKLPGTAAQPKLQSSSAVRPRVSKIPSGLLLGQVGFGSVTPKMQQTSSTSATVVSSKLPGTAARPKLPGSSAVRPKLPGTAAIRPKLPSAAAAQPKRQGSSAMRPKLPSTTAMGPKLPSADAAQPKLPGSSAVRPKLPGTAAMRPRLPSAAAAQPKHPGSSAVHPKLPGTPAMRPKLPGADAAQPKHPGSSAVHPKHPGTAAVRSKHPSAMAYGPKVPGTSNRVSASHSSSQQPRAGMSQVAKITSSTPATSRQGVRQVSGVGGHRESLPATREPQILGQAHPSSESPGNVGLPVASQEASRRVIQPGSSQATERLQGTGEDLLTIIDSTEKIRPSSGT